MKRRIRSSTWTTIVPILTHLATFLMPEECGKLRCTCKTFKNQSTLKNARLTPLLFLRAITDVLLWPNYEKLQAFICEDNHTHIQVARQDQCLSVCFADKKAQLVTKHSDWMGTSAVETKTIPWPTLEQIGTRPIRGLIARLVNRSETHMRLEYWLTYRCKERRIIVACWKNGCPCPNDSHGLHCNALDEWITKMD